MGIGDWNCVTFINAKLQFHCHMELGTIHSDHDYVCQNIIRGRKQYITNVTVFIQSSQFHCSEKHHSVGIYLLLIVWVYRENVNTFCTPKC